MKSTSTQRWKIANMIMHMAREANPVSQHGKAFQEAAADMLGYYDIDPLLSKDKASQVIRILEEAQDFFGSSEDKVLAAADVVKEIRLF